MTHRKLLAAVILSTAAFSFAQQVETQGKECDEVPIGGTFSEKVLKFPLGNREFIEGHLQITRPRNDVDGKMCTAEYRIVLKGHGTQKMIFQFNADFDGDPGRLLGLSLVGLSPSRNKFIANLWWGSGDYTAIRPLVVDLRTVKTTFAELGDEIVRQLPSCDYFEVLKGVTDDGQAMVHVPKSIYVDEGCPDQGDWYFDLEKKTVIKKQ